MESGFSFPGTFTDRGGTERITWRVSPSTRRQPPGVMGYEIETTILGVPFWGYEFDDLEPRDPDQAIAAGLRLSRLSGELTDSVIKGDLPCTIELDGQRSRAVVTFALTLLSAERGPEHQHSSPKNLHLSLIVADQHCDVDDDWFEDGVLRLDQVARRDENNRIEADHGRLKHRLQPMRGLRTDRTAATIIAGLAFVQNLRRGHYELATEARVSFELSPRSRSSPTRSDTHAHRARACQPIRQRNGTPSKWSRDPMMFDRTLVRDVCHGLPPFVRVDATLADAARTMRRRGTDAVVVVDDRAHPLGVATTTDLITSIAAPPAVTNAPWRQSADSWLWQVRTGALPPACQ